MGREESSELDQRRASITRRMHFYGLTFELTFVSFHLLLIYIT